MTESRVIPGNILPSNLGVLIVFPVNTNRLADPTSSTNFSSFAFKYITSSKPVFFASIKGSRDAE